MNTDSKYYDMTIGEVAESMTHEYAGKLNGAIINLFNRDIEFTEDSNGTITECVAVFNVENGLTTSGSATLEDNDNHIISRKMSAKHSASYAALRNLEEKLK